MYLRLCQFGICSDYGWKSSVPLTICSELGYHDDLKDIDGDEGVLCSIQIGAR